MARSILAAVEQIKADVAQFLSPLLIRTVCAAVGHVWRERILDPVTTVQLFVLQIPARQHGVSACATPGRGPVHGRGLLPSTPAFAAARLALLAAGAQPAPGRQYDAR